MAPAWFRIVFPRFGYAFFRSLHLKDFPRKPALAKTWETSQVTANHGLAEKIALLVFGNNWLVWPLYGGCRR